MMIRRGDIQDVYGVGDLGFSIGGALKSVIKAPGKVVGTAQKTAAHTFSLGRTLVKSAPGAAYSGGKALGRMATLPSETVAKAALGVAKGVGGGVGSVFGTTLGLPFGALRSLGSSLASRFKSAAGGDPGGSSTPSPATQAAAADVVTQQAAGAASPTAGYSGASVPSSGSTGSGDVGMTTSASTADTGAAATEPQTLMEKFAAMSVFGKVAVVGGIGAAGFFGYKAFKKRRGGRRSKS